MPATCLPSALRESSPTLLGPRPAPLTLRVCSGSHRERLVKIQSAKCTVGSAAGCTLRLRADGIAPLHCWILRGRCGAVVRRATGYSLLNGRTYQDAPLKPGDRLVLGSVELEVVNCEETAASTNHSSSQPSSPDLEACLAAANEEIARLENDAQQAWQTSIVASERAEQMCEALERANIELGEVRAELETASVALNRRSDARQPDIRQLEEQRARCKQLEDLLYESQRELGSAREGLQQAQVAAQDRTAQAERLQAERIAQDQRVLQLEGELRQALQATRGPVTVAMGDIQAELSEQRELQARCTAAEGEVSRLQADAEAAHAQNDAAASQAAARLSEAEQQLQHWQTEARSRQERLESLESQVASLEQRLGEACRAGEGFQRQAEELLAQLESLRAELARMQSQQAELEARDAELKARDAELKARDAELTIRDTACEDLRQRLETRQSAIATTEQQLAERDIELGEKQSLLTRQAQSLQDELDLTAQKQNELNELRSHLNGITADEAARQKQLDDQAAELVDRSEKLDEREALLSRRHQEFEEQRAAWEAERVQQNAESAVHSSAGDPSEDDLSLAMPRPAAEPQPNPHESGSVDSVLSRLVKAGLWRDEQDGSPDAGAEPAESADNRPSNSPLSANLDQQQAAKSAPAVSNAEAQHAAPAGHQDEESIESYMARLMNRVRADGGKPAPASNKPVSQPASSEHLAEQPAASPTSTAAVETSEPAEYLPRSCAKAMNGDLAAMRELANSAARGAIANHQQKHTNKRARGKLLRGAVVLLLSLGLGLGLGLWAWYAWSFTALLATAAGLSIAGVWCLLALRRMLQALRLQQPIAQVKDDEPASPAEAAVAVAKGLAPERPA